MADASSVLQQRFENTNGLPLNIKNHMKLQYFPYKWLFQRTEWHSFGSHRLLFMWVPRWQLLLCGRNTHKQQQQGDDIVSHRLPEMSNINLSDLFSLHRLSLDPALRDAVVKECEVLSADKCPNLWIRAQDVPSAPAFATQLLVHKIHQLVMSSRLSSGYAGVELWVQKYEAGKGLAFHFDKDEHALRKSGAMSHPQFSSVVYLTGDRAQPRQAPTVVCAQRYHNESKTAVPEDPGASAVVFPHRGNVLVFDGSLAHGVVHGPPSGTRMTLLINWWEQHPQDVPQLSGEVLQSVGVALVNPLDLQSLKAAASSCSAEQLKHASVGVSKHLEEGDAELVSSVCKQAGVALAGGTGAVDAVLFDHAGWELVEVDVESWAEEACGAAWVPTGTAEGDADDA